MSYTRWSAAIGLEGDTVIAQVSDAGAAALRLDGLAERLTPNLHAADLQDLKRARDLTTWTTRIRMSMIARSRTAMAARPTATYRPDRTVVR